MSKEARVRWVHALIFALAAGLVASPLAAQEDPAPVEPTNAQVQLYSKALEAFQTERYPDAIDLLKSALALGELNLLYLNLGRAYFRNGQCEEAVAAYESAITAPTVPDPPAAVILSKIKQYRGDLNKGCPGVIVVECIPAEIQVSVDGGQPQPCGEISVPAGEHTLIGTLMQDSAQTTVVVGPRGRVTATLEIQVSTDGPPSISGQALAGWSSVGLGVAALGTAVALDLLVVNPAVNDFETAVLNGDDGASGLKDDASTAQFSVLAVGGAGVALAITGVVLLLLDDEPSAQEDDAAVVVGPNGVGVSLRW